MGQYTIALEEVSLFFCSDLNTSKSLIGDNKLSASGFVINVALMQFDCNSLKIWPSGHPAWHFCFVKLNISLSPHPIHVLLTTIGLYIWHSLTTLSKFSPLILLFTVNN